MLYTHDKHCDVHLTLGICNSPTTTARQYSLRSPGRRDPDANMFRRLEQRLREPEYYTYGTRECRSLKTCTAPTSEGIKLQVWSENRG
jgi:hypothetical protein